MCADEPMILYEHSGRHFALSEREYHFWRNNAKRPNLDQPVISYHISIGNELIEAVDGNFVIEKIKNTYWIISHKKYASKYAEWVRTYKRKE